MIRTAVIAAIALLWQGAANAQTSQREVGGFHHE
jgi:hypothetical protein